MDEARYSLALRVAKAGLRRLGRSSVDGKDAHDLAMQSLHFEPWFPRIVRCDVIDAYRRERGSRGRRVVGIHNGYPARTEHRFELALDLRNRTEVLVCELLAAGYLQQEIAAVVGVTPQRISQIIADIRNRNPDAQALISKREEITHGTESDHRGAAGSDHHSQVLRHP